MLELSNEKLKILYVADALDPSLGGATAKRSFQLALALQRIVSESTADHAVTDYVQQNLSADKNSARTARPDRFRGGGYG